jgi:glutaredoxin-like protein NrdH
MKTVKIYSKDNCGQCASAKIFMQNKGIPYEEIPVDKGDKEAMKYVMSQGVRSLPFIEVGEVKLVGFNPIALLEAVKE